MDKRMREFRKELVGERLKLVELSHTGRSHYRAVIEGADGRRMIYTLANSPSDKRGSKNRLADIRRFFNN